MPVKSTHRGLFTSVSIAALLAGGVSFGAASAAGMTDLGTLPGDGNSLATYISADGSVIIGMSGPAGQTPENQFIYSNGTLSPFRAITVRGISANGQVIVGSVATSNSPNPGIEYPAEYKNGVVTVLTQAFANGGSGVVVSDDGSVVGGYSNLLRTLNGFVYVNGAVDSGSTVPTLTGYNLISDDGSVVVTGKDIYSTSYEYKNGVVTALPLTVFAMTPDGSILAGDAPGALANSYNAYKYQNGVMTNLGTLGGNNSEVFAISADGSVIVGDSDTQTFGDTFDTRHAFEYTAGTMTDLGTLGGTYSTAVGVSADGTLIVGNSSLVGGAADLHAFVYSSVSHLMTDLGTLGGSSSTAMAISRDGKTVIGYSDLAGDTAYHAFTYTLSNETWSPTPATNDWNTGANWTSGTVPLATDTAVFQTSAVTGISIQKPTTVSEMLFNPGAAAFTFNIAGGAGGAASLTVSDIVDNSSNPPQFLVAGASGNTGTLTIQGGTSGDALLTANALGIIAFSGNADAGTSRIAINAGGTLTIAGLTNGGIAIASVTGAGNIVLGSNALTIGGANADMLLGGTISGSGVLTKVGSGTLTLTGSSTNPGIAISGGTLQIGNGGTTGSVSGAILDNAQLAFDRSDIYTYAGVILGSGSVTQAGSGTTILSGTNAYTGATIVAGGTLQVDGSIASSASLTVKAGGTLQGSGTVGSVTVASGGTLSPGAGTNGVGHLSVAGAATLASGSLLRIDVGPASADLLSATGTLSVAGAVAFNFTATPRYGQSAVFATANAITGSFVSVTANLGGVLFPTVSVISAGSGQEFVETVGAGSFLTVLSNPTADQVALAQGLDAARAGHYQDLKPIYDAIDSLPAGPLGNALNQMVPDAARSLPLLSALATEDFSGLVWNHLNWLGEGGGTDGRTAFQVNTRTLQLASASFGERNGLLAVGLNANGFAAPGANMQALYAMGPSDPGMGAGGFLSGSALNGSVATGNTGSKAHVDGYLVSGGIDLRLTDRLVVGGALAYSSATATQAMAPLFGVTSQSFQGAVFGRYDSHGWFVEGFGGSAGQTAKTDRLVTPGGTTYDLRGSTSGSNPNGAILAGRSFAGDNFVVTPAAGLQLLEADIDGYTETGGTPAMTYKSVSRDSFTGRLGFDAAARFGLGDVTLVPSLHLFGVYDFAARPGPLVAAFALAPTANMSFELPVNTKTWLEYGAGLDAQIGGDARLSVRYDATAGRTDLMSGAWTGTLSVQF